MDNTYKIWDKRIYGGWRNDLFLATDGTLYYNSEPVDPIIMQFISICHAVGLKDKNGVRLYANDIIKTPKGTLYIIQYERCLASWQAWDFKAWAKGYYDAYTPLHEAGAIVPEDCTQPCIPEPKFCDVVKVGTVFENPELCPEIFDNNEVKS